MLVKIPETRNPFTVTLNGVEYAYQAGKEVEVPDAIGELILSAVKATDNLTETDEVVPPFGSGDCSGGGADIGMPTVFLHRPDTVILPTTEAERLKLIAAAKKMQVLTGAFVQADSYMPSAKYGPVYVREAWVDNECGDFSIDFEFIDERVAVGLSYEEAGEIFAAWNEIFGSDIFDEPRDPSLE